MIIDGIIGGPPCQGFSLSGKRDPKDPSTWGKVMRNELCPCGSGKKYKQCCGKIG